MIRVDYQKKANAVLPPSGSSALSSPSPTTVPTTTATTLIDPGAASPVSSIQEEFYSYLGISSKSSGDSDAEPSTTTPSKSPLDEYDLNKRRSLRVRVVNKLREHQAKMLKMAESVPADTSPGGDDEEPAKGNGLLHNGDSDGKMEEDDDEEESQSTSTDSLSATSNTILARRCYTSITTTTTGTTSTSSIKSQSPSPTVIRVNI